MRAHPLFAPGFRAKPWWWEAAEPVAGPPVALPGEAEVAIIGGGYTGLSAALTLARLGHRPVVLDMEPIGYGASSRNGGMVSGALKLATGDLAATLGPERAERLIREVAGSLGFVEETIAREGIACHYTRSGRFVAAWSRRHWEAMAARAEWLAAVTGGRVWMVPPERTREELGTDHYRGGMVVEAAGALHPALYVQGLARAAARAGAVLIDRTRVTAIARQGDTFRLATERGTIVARAVLAATNGYTGAATPWLARRLIPVASSIIATEELPAETMARLFPTRRMINDSRRVLNYFRPDPTFTRVLWGGRARFGPVTPEEAASVLHGFMTAVFPELRDVRISHAWTGNVAFTFDFLPHLGVHEGMHYAVGCQGSGVAMQTWLGHRAALKIAGAANSETAFDGLPFPTLPLYAGRPWFLPLVGAWYRTRDRLDRMAA
ncbi:FAD-binding oxidoreductase [Elioraea sp. Yellowstone]|uniref:NAD(P)/FAD-dependent oxidoreductase n=1 Tax=Elioraea sp. Yellowstone TaxID=2592070 RepID=UPI00192A4ADB|nr:FAD-binding oxidoreductase [Elioraea sp. Yellowstone]